MAKGSIRALLRLVGEIEDGELEATQHGILDAARYLSLAKLEIVKELAKLEARRARLRVARRAAINSDVIPFPVPASATSARRRAEDISA